MKKEEKNIQKILDTTYGDTHNFLASKGNWAKFNNMPTVCDGILYAIFEMIFDVAPNKDCAIELINFRLNHFIDDKYKTTEYRVYKSTETPLKGSENYFDVGTKEIAIKLTQYLNKNDKYKKWVWA